MKPVKAGYHSHRRPKRAPAPLGLTRAEWRIVQAICAGVDSRLALADMFKLSPRTVDTHTRNIETKLGTNSRVGIVLAVLADEAARAKAWAGLKIEEVGE